MKLLCLSDIAKRSVLGTILTREGGMAVFSKITLGGGGAVVALKSVSEGKLDRRTPIISGIRAHQGTCCGALAVNPEVARWKTAD
jgi:hypothetical protein